jgi:acyl-CoA thioesterase FadM
MPFTRTIAVRFDEADARGILFYGRVHELAHRVFEDFVATEVAGRWEDWFLSSDFIVPIRHAEATFHRPMRPGQRYEAELSVMRLGESSFDVRVKFFVTPDTGLKPSDTGLKPRATSGTGDDRVLCAETLVSHVFADAERFRKIPIPSGLRSRLETHLASE